jgi:hypothetical protein
MDFPGEVRGPVVIVEEVGAAPQQDNAAFFTAT